jgi:ubiquinol-cytochrome c reductase iron-sulfur subunit
MLDSMNPSSDLRTPYWVDLSDIPEGGRKTVYWGDWPIYIAHRTPKEIAAARKFYQEYAHWPRHPLEETDQERVTREQWLVVIGLDPWGDCLVTGQHPDENRGKWGGWYSPCSGRSYDTSGRAFGDYGWGGLNLYVPPYRFTSDTEIAFPHQRKSH